MRGAGARAPFGRLGLASVRGGDAQCPALIRYHCARSLPRVGLTGRMSAAPRAPPPYVSRLPARPFGFGARAAKARTPAKKYRGAPAPPMVFCVVATLRAWLGPAGTASDTTSAHPSRSDLRPCGLFTRPWVRGVGGRIPASRAGNARFLPTSTCQIAPRFPSSAPRLTPIHAYLRGRVHHEHAPRQAGGLPEG